jgi:hypothetical protein
VKIPPFRRSRVILSGLLLLAVLALRGFAADRDRVEYWYSTVFYPHLGSFQRTALGWLPFSLGDMIYTLAGGWILYKAFRLIVLWRRGELHADRMLRAGTQLLFLAAGVYLYFNLAWGLNYNRRGIAMQLGLKVDTAQAGQIDHLAAELLSRVNTYASYGGQRDLLHGDPVRDRAIAAYRAAGKLYPFLAYHPVSFKNSIFGVIGNYVGYSGYYNPFTGEAQMNDRIPRFTQPYVSLHEIGHQLGYARENEANFVAFLAARQSRDSALLYSTYFDLFLYANAALYGLDSAKARANLKSLQPAVQRDLKELREFSRRYENPVDRLVDVFYDHFLKLNQQPAGQRSYNQVVLWLIAYERKFGEL